MNASSNQAYNRGLQDFYGRDFLIAPSVLIPRPETEAIIDIVKSLAGKSILPGVKAREPKIAENAKILDVGTGSGCIAITIKKELPFTTVTGVDIDESTLEIAGKNAERLAADVKLIKSNLLKNIKEQYDIIIANLPYVDPEWDWLDKEALSIEPSIALYAEDHGLALIKELIDQAKLNPPKYLILEADPCQHEEITKYATKNGFQHAETRGFALLFSFCTRQE